MTEVPLSKWKVALIDEEDAARVLAIKWSYTTGARRRQEYAVHTVYHANGPGKHFTLRLHHFVLNVAPGTRVDHRDGDGLNCQKKNLRVATPAQNQQNRRLHRNSTTGFKGVCLIRRRQPLYPYWAQISAHGVKKSLGYFRTAEDAARAYDQAARDLHGEFARLNFPTANEEGARA